MSNTILQCESTCQATVTLGNVFTPIQIWSCLEFRYLGMKSPIQSATSQSHSVLMFVTTRCCSIIAFKRLHFFFVICNQGWITAQTYTCQLNYSESMDSCHGQLDDKKFHVMLWSETVIRDWIFEPEYAVLILTPSTLGKIWEILKKTYFTVEYCHLVEETRPNFFTLVIKWWFSLSGQTFSLMPL